MVKPSLKALSLTLGAAACIAVAAYAASAPSGSAATPGASAPLAQSGAPATTPGAMPGAMPTTSPTTTQTAAPLSDAEIVGVMNTVDQHEINAANKSMKMKMGKDANEYAKMLKMHHTDNMAKTKKMAKQIRLKPATSPVADTLRSKGAREVKAMTALKGAEFEKAYIDAEVNGHTEVLQMLDSQLIPAAKNDTLKTHLTEVRGHIATHLEQGKRMQGANAASGQ